MYNIIVGVLENDNRCDINEFIVSWMKSSSNLNADVKLTRGGVHVLQIVLLYLSLCVYVDT